MAFGSGNVIPQRQRLWDQYLGELPTAARFYAEEQHGKSARLWIKGMSSGPYPDAPPSVLQTYLQRQSLLEYKAKNPPVYLSGEEWAKPKYAISREEAFKNLAKYRYKMPKWAQKKVWP